MASKVPKFASFQPKPKDQPREEPVKDEISQSSRKNEKKDRHERHAKPHRAIASSTSYRDRSPKPVSSKSSRIPSKQKSNSYFVDVRGDRANLTYGSSSRYDTPRYRRHGYGSILGLSPDYKIDRAQSTEKCIVLIGPASLPRERVLTSQYAAKEVNGPVRLVKAAPGSQATEDVDFIELPRGKKRKRASDHDTQGPDHRPWDFQKEENSSESDSDASPDDQPDPIATAITQKNSMLIQRTRSRPNELQGWLGLVEHQEQMMKLGRMSSELSTTDRRSLAEVRISIYEEAIRKIGNIAKDQVVLHLGLMKEASKAWDSSTLERKWTEILAKFPESSDIWLRYLDFRQTSFGGFKHDNCRDTFHQCLKALRSISCSAPPEAYLHVLLRLTDMFRSSGYQELACAIWQVLLEYHLLPPGPRRAEGQRNSAMESFEEFWESEVPRIGEPEARGWRSFNTADVGLPTSGPAQLKAENPNVPVIDDFQVREMDRIEKLRFPGRMTDSIGEDDPFHVILFSDVAEYLQILPPDTSELLILDAFLCFSHLPPLPGLIDSDKRQWWSDPIMNQELVSPESISAQDCSFAEVLKAFSSCPGNYKMTLEVLFDQGFPDNSEARLLDGGSPDSHIRFIRQVLALLAKEQSRVEPVGEYLLAFEKAHFPAEAFRTAKQLIKSMPTSLRLYNAYALVESRLGNSAKADQVCRAALSMPANATLAGTSGLLPLFHTWVWEALRCNDQLEALWRLVSPPDKGHSTVRPDGALHRPDQTSLLRGHSLLNEAIDRALLGRDFPSAILSASLLALLVYLSKDGDIRASLAIHEKLSKWFLAHGLAQSDAAELQAQSIANLLVYHATHASIIKPALLREALCPLLDVFPNNTVLLSVHAANEARFSIDDRVRAVMQRSILGDRDNTILTAWLFAIFHEMYRGEIAGATSHSVRALFLKAAATDAGHSPALWCSFVLFEFREYGKESKKRSLKRTRRDKKQSKHQTLLEESQRRVREVFFRGLTHLPWCKDYMMMGFTLLKEILDGEDKKKVYNVMIEKELRVYVEVGL